MNSFVFVGSLLLLLMIVVVVMIGGYVCMCAYLYLIFCSFNVSPLLSFNFLFSPDYFCIYVCFLKEKEHKEE